jgi:hypothetical protein
MAPYPFLIADSCRVLQLYVRRGTTNVLLTVSQMNPAGHIAISSELRDITDTEL